MLLTGVAVGRDILPFRCDITSPIQQALSGNMVVVKYQETVKNITTISIKSNQKIKINLDEMVFLKET